MSNPNLTCVYATLSDIRDAKRLKRIDENQGLLRLKEISHYDIKNALTKSALIKYMFESLQWQIGCGKIRDDVDKLHIRVYMYVKRKSECDFPRGAIRNGIIDGTKW
jgi:hypothetical protein